MTSLAQVGRRAGTEVDVGLAFQRIATLLLRYGLVLVIAWLGAMKFTGYEARAIQPLIGNSPFLSWMYEAFSTQAVSNLFGTIELTVAALIAMRPLSARMSAAGSAIAVTMFLTTLTFLFSTPGWEPSLGGFPALSPAGGFLVKDVILLGAAVWSLGESATAMRLP